MVCFYSISCQNNAKKAAEMNTLDVNLSADSLAEYFAVPKSSECKWFIKPMGETNSRVPGPTDYELFALIRLPDNLFIEQLISECPAIEEMDEGIPIDPQIFSLLGMETVPGGKEYNGKMVLEGRVLNMDKKIKNPFSDGVGLIISPTLLFITASTF